MPESCRNSFHTSDVNRESLSDTMSAGRPWCYHTSWAKMIARSAAIFSRSRMKYAILVNRSMITHSWLYPSEIGSSVMKSIAIDCHGAYGSSSREDSPYGWCWAALFCWHSGQLQTKSMIRLFIFSHQRFRRISSMVLSWPMCPATLVSCSDSRILCTSSFGTQSRFFRYSTPFSFPSSLTFRSFDGSSSTTASCFLACS